MEVATSSVKPKRDPSLVYDGDYVILCELKGRQLVQIKKGKSVKYFKKNVKMDNIIGARYGSNFQIEGNTFVESSIVLDDVMNVDEALPVNDNRNIQDDKLNNNQNLTESEIRELKKTATGDEMIQKLIDSSKSFQQKTQFSQAKYLKRKQAKYLKVVTVKPVTLEEMCSVYTMKAPFKILQLRIDTIGQILTRANIQPNARNLICETTMGLLTAAVLQRMGGFGTLVQLHPGDNALTNLCTHFNFSEDEMAILQTYPLHLVNVSKREVNLTLDQLKQEVTDTLGPKPSAEDESETLIYEERERKRVAARLKLINKAKILDAGLFDSLIVATRYDPTDIFLKLLPYLAPSRSFIIYCPSKEPLLELYYKLMDHKECLRLNLFETWTREYQVLPQRTRPLNQMHSTSGYIISGIRILDPTVAIASSIDATPSSKRVKVEEEVEVPQPEASTGEVKKEEEPKTKTKTKIRIRTRAPTNWPVLW